MVCLRLTRKFAEKLDGVDLASYRVGQLLYLPWHAAALILAEGWAEFIERRRRPRNHVHERSRELASACGTPD